MFTLQPVDERFILAELFLYYLHTLTRTRTRALLFHLSLTNHNHILSHARTYTYTHIAAIYNLKSREKPIYSRTPVLDIQLDDIYETRRQITYGGHNTFLEY